MIDNPYDTPAAVIGWHLTVRQFEMTTRTEDLSRVRLMYAVLCTLQLPAMLTETAPDQAVVRVNCTQAQWDEAVRHVDWVTLRCHLEIEVPS